MAIDKDLLDILACPACKQPITEDGDWLVCAQCQKKYPVRDGIPVMLIEEAVALSADDTDSGSSASAS